MPDLDPTALAEMTSEMVAVYVAQNHHKPSELPNLIASVHAALGGLGKSAAPAVSAEPPKPAVPVERSITDDYIVRLGDGRKLKSMKRYLVGLGMTPADYRAKWGLPNDYPIWRRPTLPSGRSWRRAWGSGAGGRRARSRPTPRSTRLGRQSTPRPSPTRPGGPVAAARTPDPARSVAASAGGALPCFSHGLDDRRIIVDVTSAVHPVRHDLLARGALGHLCEHPVPAVAM